MPTNTQDLKEQNPKDFPNIIFDYGGVILDIDVNNTVDAFQRLLPTKVDNFQFRIESSEVFMDLERGRIGEKDFLHRINSILEANITWEDFEMAWNAMIGVLPVENVEVIERISYSHRIFLLSNTNSIHLRKVNEVVKETIGAGSIDHLFEKAYYSNHMGMRKPDMEIYNYVLKEQGLDPKETIFLDDNPINLEGAAKAGLAVFHIKNERGIKEIF